MRDDLDRRQVFDGVFESVVGCRMAMVMIVDGRLCSATADSQNIPVNDHSSERPANVYARAFFTDRLISNVSFLASERLQWSSED